MPAPKYLLDVKEAAMALGISQWTVRYLMRTRQLSRVRIGTRVLISTSELNRFIEAHTEPASKPINPKSDLACRLIHW